MFKKVSIFSLLVLQAFISILLLVILGVVSHLSSTESLKQQEVLTEVVIPLQEKIQMNQSAESNSILHMNRIGLSKSLSSFLKVKQEEVQKKDVLGALKEIQVIISKAPSFSLNKNEYKSFSDYGQDQSLVALVKNISSKLTSLNQNLNEGGEIYIEHLGQAHQLNESLISGVEKLDDSINQSIVNMNSLAGKIRFSFKKKTRSIKKSLKKMALEDPLDDQLKQNIKAA
ncbi:hypothetical protein MJH12_09020, partial [bacterium]|nr:hypothetical protein [bacterium]